MAGLVAVVGAAACSTPSPAPAAPTTAPLPTAVAPPAAASPSALASPSASAAAVPSVAAASPVAQQAPAQGGGSGAHVQIGFTSTSAANSAIWGALDGGYFQQQGLDAELVGITASPAAVAAILSGQIPLNAGISGTQMVAANLKGGDTILLAATINTFPDSVLVQPELTSVEQLRGKKMGVTQFGSAADTAARVFLEHYGIDPTNDITLLQTGGLAQTLAGLQARAFDAGLLSPPVTQAGIRAGFPELADVGSLGIQYVYNGVGTTRKYLAENHDLLYSIMQAIVAGAHRMKTDKDFGIAVLKHWTNVDDQQTLDDTWTSFEPRYLSDRPFVTDDGMRTVLNEVAETTPEAASADPATFHDDSLLNQLDQAGYFRQLGIS